jgi:hypothetical protein
LTRRKQQRPTRSDDRAMSQSTSFDQLLAAAATQAEPQILLFVFAAAGLPSDASPAQRARFEVGQGGELTPLMCVEKALDELTTFEALVAESHDIGPPWTVVFAAGLSGHGGQPPAPKAVEGARKMMVERVRTGAVESLLALTPAGEAVRFS